MKLRGNDILQFLLDIGAVKVGESAIKYLLGTDKDAETRPESQRPKYGAQPIKPRERKMPHALFDEMRRIPAQTHNMGYYWSAEESEKQFVAQAQFMRDFEDSYEKPVPENETFYYGDVYRSLSDNHLRAYFTWRKHFRQGKITQPGAAFISIHAHELFYGVGAMDYEDGMAKIASLWKAYGRQPLNMNAHLVDLCVEYYMAGACEIPFREFMSRMGIEEALPLRYRFDTWTGEGTFQMCRALADYKLEDSKFYAEDKLPLMEGCYVRAMRALGALFETKKLKANTLLWGRPKKQKDWKPKYQLELCPWYRKPAGDIVLCANEWYTYQDGQYVHYAADAWKRGGDIILGYMLKRIEMQLRVLTGFKYRLSPNKEALEKALKHVQYRNKLFYDILEQGLIDEAIDRAVKEYMAERQMAERQKVVSIDPRKLNKIRKDAEVTQERLIVEEASKEEARWEESIPETPVPKAARLHPEAPPESEEEQDEWAAFAAALTALQWDAMHALTAGAARELDAVAVRAGVLPGVMLEEINELALQYVGDNIVDTAAQPVSIYEDYLGNIHQIIGGK